MRKSFALACILFLTAALGNASAQTLAWPVFPKPGEVWTQPEAREFPARVLQQTAAGLAANHARKNSLPGVYVWIAPSHHADYTRWLQAWQARTKLTPRPVDGDAWALVHELKGRGLVSSYVLYHSDRWERRAPLYAGVPPRDLSLNLATSLCGPLDAVAVEEKDQPQADALGLRLAADCRGKDYAWLLKEHGAKFNPLITSMLDPRSAIARDMAVACDAPVILNTRGGGVDEVLPRTTPGGFVFGWGLNGEDEFVSAASKRGLEMLAANWSCNLPVLAADPAPINKQTTPIKPAPDAPGTRYVAFVQSDGDNITWLMGDYASGQKFFAHPDRGSLPFGWSMTLPSLAALGPDAWNYYVGVATPNDDFVQIGLNAYGFIDETPVDLIARQAALLDRTLARAGVNCMVGFTHTRWDSGESKRGFQCIADHCPSLRAILPLQYWPYAAGRGALLWQTRSRDGRKIPVLTPRSEIRKVDNPSPVAGPPDYVAGLLNDWASKPVRNPEDRFAWVIVHAWTDFGNRVTGVGAAKACAEKLDPGIKVIKPSELAERLYRSANPE